jgi:hypothetical protein
VDLLRSSVYERQNSLTSAAAAVVPPPLALEEAAAAVLVSSQQEPLMVANAALFVQQPPPLEPELLAGSTAGAPDGTVAGGTDGATVCDGAANGSRHAGAVKVLEKHDVRLRR